MLRSNESQSEMQQKYRDDSNIKLLGKNQLENITNLEQPRIIEYQYINPSTSASESVKKSNKSVADDLICKFDNKEILSENTKIYKNQVLETHKKLLATREKLDRSISDISMQLSEIQKY